MTKMTKLTALAIALLSSTGAMAMSVEDYTLDKKSLTGQTVSVTGSPACLSGELCYLYSTDDGRINAMVSVVFDPSALPREDRKKLLSCNPFSNPCDATITITGSTALFGAKAKSIAWGQPQG